MMALIHRPPSPNTQRIELVVFVDRITRLLAALHDMDLWHVETFESSARCPFSAKLELWIVHASEILNLLILDTRSKDKTSKLQR